MTDAVLTAYLTRLGYAAPPSPALETLVDLHRRHLAQVPYDNLDIMLGRPPSVDPDLALARVGEVGRAGYCFSQNGSFGRALELLGFTVHRRRGFVDATPRGGALNHLVLFVDGLPTAANPGGRWWPDVGLGDGFLEPLPLMAGEYVEHGFRYRIDERPGDMWEFTHDPAGAFRGIEIGGALESAELDASHAQLSTPPDGKFTQMLAVFRRTDAGTRMVRGITASEVKSTARTDTETTSYDEWRAALDGVGLPLDDVDDDELRGLHARMIGVHLAWVEAGRP
ncbi:MAG: arylamine N-acetyltransferase family protein [Nocardioides sp.]